MALLGGILALMVIAWTVRASIWTVYHVPTVSMAPTLLPGDVVLVDRTAYGWRLPWGSRPFLPVEGPQPGDVVVLRAPYDPDVVQVKRVVAVEGQEVAFRGGFAVVDGRRPSVEWVGRAVQQVGCRPRRAWVWRQTFDDRTVDLWLDDDLGSLLRDRPPVLVPEDHVFVVGDHRDRSVDSRQHGPVPVRDVLGRVSTVVLSFDPCTGRRRLERSGTPVSP